MLGEMEGIRAVADADADAWEEREDPVRAALTAWNGYDLTAAAQREADLELDRRLAVALGR
jgi:hypothetical protein